MASPYLSSDESVILATDNIVFRTATLAALVLTNKRLILIQAHGDDLSADEILHTTLRSADVDKFSTDVPVLNLAYISETGEIRKETLTFSEKPGMQRKEECTDWARKLSEQIVPFREEGTIVRIPPPEPATVAKAAEEPVPIPAAPPVPPVTPAGTPPPDRTVPLIRQIHTPPDMASAEDIFAKHARMAGLAFPQVPKVTEPEAPARGSHRTIFIVGAIVLFILAVAAGAWVLTQYHPQRPGQPAAPAATTPVGSPIITMVPTTVPGTTPPPPTPVPSGTPVSGSEESPVTVPTNGVWVKVQYSGNYTGVIGGGSTLLPVEGSGNKLFQITIKSGIIRVMVEKSDGSGRQMVIDVFRDGDRINHGETNIPHGEVNLQFELAPPTTATTVPAMTPVNSTAP